MATIAAWVAPADITSDSIILDDLSGNGNSVIFNGMKIYFSTLDLSHDFTIAIKTNVQWETTFFYFKEPSGDNRLSLGYDDGSIKTYGTIGGVYGLSAPYAEGELYGEIKLIFSYSAENGFCTLYVNDFMNDNEEAYWGDGSCSLSGCSMPYIGTPEVAKCEVEVFNTVLSESKRLSWNGVNYSSIDPWDYETLGTRRQIIVHGENIYGNHVNFPVRIILPHDPDMETAFNGGNLVMTQDGNVIFCELNSVGFTNGATEYHLFFLANHLNEGEDTVFYLYYDGVSPVKSGFNSSAVWLSSAKSRCYVEHFKAVIVE